MNRILVIFLFLGNFAAAADPVVDARTLHHKVLTGYQGWFRCPNDPAKEGWRHWSRDGRQITPETLTFEMWPDMSEFDEDEKYPATGFTDSAGKPAHLFSSMNSKTVDRHFRWMQQYEIDGVFLQRFLADLHSPSVDQVIRLSVAKQTRFSVVNQTSEIEWQQVLIEELIRR